MLAHERKDRASEVDDAPEVGVNLALEFVGGHLLEGSDEAVAGVIDEDIDVAEVSGGGGDGGFGLGRVLYVECEGEDAFAVLLDEGCKLMGITGGGGEEVSVGEDRFGEGAAETADAPVMSQTRWVAMLICFLSCGVSGALR